MLARSQFWTWLGIATILGGTTPSALTPACCPAPPPGSSVVNADQTVVMVWNPETKEQHFIRQASFNSDGDKFGFIVPTPSQPQLEESGNEAFALLKKLTEPEIKYAKRSPQPVGCGCSAAPKSAVKADRGAVEVLEEKRVAGFDAVVLEATDAAELVKWLNEHGFEFSKAVEDWAKPYVEQNWKFTALQVAKADDDKEQNEVKASSLRISFKTEKPLFPYREPDMRGDVEKLGAKSRLLRIYFLADQRYQGDLTKEEPWTGKVAWSGKLSAQDTENVRGKLGLPEANDATTQWWLTEFEDNWPYRPAPADVYFSVAGDQSTVKRPPITIGAYGPPDAMPMVIAVVLLAPVLLRRRRS